MLDFFWIYGDAELPGDFLTGLSRVKMPGESVRGTCNLPCTEFEGIKSPTIAAIRLRFSKASWIEHQNARLGLLPR